MHTDLNAGQAHSHFSNFRPPASFHNKAGLQNDLESQKVLDTTQVKILAKGMLSYRLSTRTMGVADTNNYIWENLPTFDRLLSALACHLLLWIQSASISLLILQRILCSVKCSNPPSFQLTWHN